MLAFLLSTLAMSDNLCVMESIKMGRVESGDYVTAGFDVSQIADARYTATSTKDFPGDKYFVQSKHVFMNAPSGVTDLSYFCKWFVGIWPCPADATFHTSSASFKAIMKKPAVDVTVPMMNAFFEENEVAIGNDAVVFEFQHAIAYTVANGVLPPMAKAHGYEAGVYVYYKCDTDSDWSTDRFLTPEGETAEQPSIVRALSNDTEFAYTTTAPAQPNIIDIRLGMDYYNTPFRAESTMSLVDVWDIKYIHLHGDPEAKSWADLAGTAKYMYVDFGQLWCITCHRVMHGNYKYTEPAVTDMHRYGAKCRDGQAEGHEWTNDFNGPLPDLFPILKNNGIKIMQGLDIAVPSITNGWWGTYLTNAELQSVHPADQCRRQTIDTFKAFSPAAEADYVVDAVPAHDDWGADGYYTDPTMGKYTETFDPTKRLNPITYGTGAWQLDATFFTIVDLVGKRVMQSGLKSYRLDAAGVQRESVVRRIFDLMELDESVLQEYLATASNPTAPPMNTSERCDYEQRRVCNWCKDSTDPHCMEEFARQFENWGCCEPAINTFADGQAGCSINGTQICSAAKGQLANIASDLMLANAVGIDVGRDEIEKKYSDNDCCNSDCHIKIDNTKYNMFAGSFE